LPFIFMRSYTPMTILIPNAMEAGMPEVMIGHCKQLLEWRLEKLYANKMPVAGDGLEVLYSEKDPLMESDEVDDNAYFIYFTISAVEGDQLSSANITIDLVY
jgi:hypothetical protein